MTEHRSLQAPSEDLKKKAAPARSAELEDAKARIIETMDTCGLTLAGSRRLLKCQQVLPGEASSAAPASACVTT
jgi:hypothetical protein